MKYIIFVVIIYLSYQEVLAQQSYITVGKTDSIYSSILKEERRIWIHVPFLEEREIYEKQKFPVLYLLDGETANFSYVKSLVEQLSLTNGNTILPQMIIVGIQNTDRTRDLTPSRMEAQTSSGGGEQFISFLRSELIPYIDSIYPTAPYRLLAGHSLGGLSVIYTLIHYKDLFDGYIAIDPSMWWDNQKLLKESEDIFKSGDYPNISVYLGIANTMENEMDLFTAQSDTSNQTLLLRANMALGGYLTESNSIPNAKWKYYPEEDHMTIPSIAIYDGLRYIFKDYNIKVNEQHLFDASINLDSILSKQYAEASIILNYPIKPPGDIVNGLGNFMMMLNHFDKAERLFKMNAQNYPNAYNVYEALGDFYYEKGEKEKATESYKKALAIQDIPHIRKKLKLLQ